MANAEIQAKAKLGIIKEEILHILEPGEVGAVLELTVTDREGNITDRQVIKSKSFVRGFLEMLWTQGYPYEESTGYSVRDITNTLRTICENAPSFNVMGGIGNTSLGVVVGTGTNAPTINDYALQIQISHGSGAGQLQYSAVTIGAPASDSTTSQFTVTRNFANGSGGSITVNEIGLYCQGYKYDSYYYFCLIRDVIAGGIAVPNGQTLTVNYRILATV